MRLGCVQIPHVAGHFSGRLPERASRGSLPVALRVPGEEGAELHVGDGARFYSAPKDPLLRLGGKSVRGSHF